MYYLIYLLIFFIVIFVFLILKRKYTIKLKRPSLKQVIIFLLFIAIFYSIKYRFIFINNYLTNDRFCLFDIDCVIEPRNCGLAVNIFTFNPYKSKKTKNNYSDWNGNGWLAACSTPDDSYCKQFKCEGEYFKKSFSDNFKMTKIYSIIQSSLAGKPMNVHYFD